MKVKSCVDVNHLKKAVRGLPEGVEDEGIRFRALFGDKKGEKVKCGGLFIGPQMLPEFETERKNFTSVTLLEGRVKKSSHDPDHRLVLVSKTTASTLKDVAKSSLKLAKLRYTLVVLKPGEDEPVEVAADTDDVLDDENQENQVGDPREEFRGLLSARLHDIQTAAAHPTWGPDVRDKLTTIRTLLQAQGTTREQFETTWNELLDVVAQVAEANQDVNLLQPEVEVSEDRLARQRQKQESLKTRLTEAAQAVHDGFAPGRAKEIEKLTNRLVGGTGKQFTPVLAALKLVEERPTEGNLTDLETAAKAYLAHVEDDYFEKDRKDKINALKIATAENALKTVHRLRQIALLQKKREQLGAPPWDEDKERQVRELEAGLVLAGGKAEVPAEKGASDSFVIRDHSGAKTYFFKTMLGEHEVEGMPPGGGVAREAMLSNVNDHLKDTLGLDFGVAKTSLVTLENDDFQKGHHSQQRRQVGALVNFVPNDGDLEKNLNFRLDELDRDDAHKMAFLDFLTLNMDRSIGNALTRREGGRVRLIPIDAGLSLPSPEMFKARCQTTMSGSPSVDGQRLQGARGSLSGRLPQNREPFSQEMLDKIAQMDPEALAGKMRGDYETMCREHPEMVGKMEPATFDMVELSARFLKKAAPVLTPYELSIAYSVAEPGFKDLLDAAPNDRDGLTDQIIVAARAAAELELTEAREAAARRLRGAIGGIRARIERDLQLIPQKRSTPAIDDDKRRVTELLGQDWAAALDGLPNLTPEQVYEIETVVVRMHTALEEAKPR